MKKSRVYRPSDHLIAALDQVILTLSGHPQSSGRSNPSEGLPEADLNDEKRLETARLMRINHTGEVCAQGLYQGQALSADLPQVRQSMEQAALEENDHLAWCETRLHQLDNRKSLLNPFWYLGSFAIGVGAGIAGDRWSLGFVAETERQVGDHLARHLDRLDPEDQRSRSVLQQMHQDELRHAQTASESGAAPLPAPIRLAMKLSAKVMTGTVYWI